MRTSVPLDRLPDSLSFPPELGGRASFDADRRQLCFDGFMSKLDFDRLVRLSNDLQYQRALEALFQRSSDAPLATEPAAAWSPSWWIAGLAGAAAALTSALILFR